jgi:hypothetical protein
MIKNWHLLNILLEGLSQKLQRSLKIGKAEHRKVKPTENIRLQIYRESGSSLTVQTFVLSRITSSSVVLRGLNKRIKTLKRE